MHPKNTYHTSADDHSRVVLSERDANGSDYINGAYIDVSDQQHRIQRTYTHTHTHKLADIHTHKHGQLHACTYCIHRLYPQLPKLENGYKSRPDTLIAS